MNSHGLIQSAGLRGLARLIQSAGLSGLARLIQSAGLSGLARLIQSAGLSEYLATYTELSQVQDLQVLLPDTAR